MRVMSHRQHVLLTTVLMSGVVPWTSAYAGTCSGSGANVTCTGAANSASDTYQTFNGLPDGAVVNVTGGIDTSQTATNQHALALDSVGALTVTVAATGELLGSNYGLAVRTAGDLTLTNGGLITSVNSDGVYAAVNGGNAVVTNNGTIDGGVYGVFLQSYGDGAVTINTGANSITSGGPAQSLETASGNPWGEPDMLEPAANEVLISAGIGLEKLGGSGDVSVTTGANSQVDGIHGILVSNHGTGNSYVTVGDGATVSGMGPDPDFSAAALGGSGISVVNDTGAGEILIRTGTGSTINATAASTDLAPFGIAAQSITAAPVTIITGADSHVAASAFGILAQAGQGDTHITTGSNSLVDATISGIVSVGYTDLDVTVGDGALVQGKWTGILSTGMGDVTVTTGTGSQVIGAGGFDGVNNMPPGFESLPEMPQVPPGVPLELTTVPAAGIKIIASGKNSIVDPDNPDAPQTFAPVAVSVTTGNDSLVEGKGTFANGIDIITAGGDRAAIHVTTGESSTVRGGDGMFYGSLGMGVGISVVGQGITGADILIDTGNNSLVEGGAAGIATLAVSNFQPNTTRITTGAGSTVAGMGTPLVIDLVDENQPGMVQHTVTPVVGISASGFGSVDSDIHIITGANSTVTAPTFGIQATSGVLNTAITIETGANSVVSATGSGTESYVVMDGEVLSLQSMYEVMGLYTPASGIFVSSAQFNEMNVFKPNVQGEQEFYSRTSKAGDINVTTGTNSTVIGTDNGITVGTMMVSQREAFWPTGQDEVDPATIIWAPGRVDPGGMVYGTDGDNDPDNDPVLEHQSVMVASDKIGGKVNINVNGTVTGQEQHGIYATNTANAVDLNVTVGKTGIVEGALDGIYAVTDRTLLISGEAGEAIGVFDPETGIPRPATEDDFASSIATITNQGIIRNLSKKSVDLAIHTDNTATTINNEGLVLGTVDLDSRPGNHFINKAGGVWNTAGGINYLGAVDGDGLPIAPNTVETRAGSTIIAAADRASAETTVFNGVKTFSHGGLLTLQDGAANDRAVITGPGVTFVSNGGVLALDTVLASDGAPSDLLVVEGATQLGTAPVGIAVRNAGGPGAATVADGIKVVQVDGASAAQAFALIGDYQVQGQQVVASGAYAYTLWHNGVGDNAEDGDWYLRSKLHPTKPTDPNDPTDPSDPDGTLYQAGAGLAEIYPQALLAMIDLPTLQQRVGNRHWSGAGASADGTATPSYTDNGGLWARVEGARTKIDPARSTTGSRYDVDRLLVQVGADMQLSGGENGVLIGGVTAHYTNGDAKVRSFIGDGRIAMDGYGVGATLTWYGGNGFYLDAQAQATWFASKLQSDQLGKMTGNNDGFGFTASVEAGKRYNLGSKLSLTPQAQLVYAAVDFDKFVQMKGDVEIAPISQRSAHSLRGRLGLSLDSEHKGSGGDRTHFYGIANLYYQFEGQTHVDVADASFRNRADRFWGGLGAGGSYNWNEDRMSIYGEVDASSSLADFGDSYALKGTIGFRYRW